MEQACLWHEITESYKVLPTTWGPLYDPVISCHKQACSICLFLKREDKSTNQTRTIQLLEEKMETLDVKCTHENESHILPLIIL